MEDSGSKLTDANLRDLVKLINKNIEELLTEVKQKTDNHAAKLENLEARIEKRCSSMENIVLEVTKQMEILDLRLDKLEFNNIYKDLVIKDLPPTSGEDLRKMFRIFCNRIGCHNITPTSIFRPANQQKSRAFPIIVKFVTLDDRITILKHISRRSQKITLRDFGIESGMQNSVVRIAQSLTKHDREIRNLARVMRINHKISSYFVSMSRVFIVTKHKNEKVMITSKEQLIALGKLADLKEK